ncbi:MAG: hypothetical protein PHI71_13800 [Acidiphilium sp.]|nr:hypothetical protein [Acidiphilium sp.]
MSHSPSLIRAALRNYASAVFIRENPMLISAVFMTVAATATFEKASRIAAHGGATALFAHRTSFVFLWWYVAFYLPACLMFHYWRQVRSNLAVSIPHLKDTEFTALVLLLVPVGIAFAAPLILLHAPVWGAIALATVAMAGGSVMSFGVPNGQSRKVALSKAVLFLPLMLAGSQPQYLRLILFAAPLPASVITLAAAAFIVSGLRFYPARAAEEAERAEHRADLAAARPRRTSPIVTLFDVIFRVMTWKPAFMADRPMPSTLGVRSGPIGTVLVQGLQMALFLFYMPAFAWVQGHDFMKALIQTAPQSLGFFGAITIFGSGQWLLDRSDWPPLFMAGRYGGRSGFSQAMSNAFRMRAIELAIIDALLLTGAALALGIIDPPDAIPTGLSSFALIFGASYGASLPLLWHEIGGRGFTMALALAGGLGTMEILGTGLLHHSPRLWAIAATIVIFACGLAMSRIAPRRLTTMDWPIETASPA